MRACTVVGLCVLAGAGAIAAAGAPAKQASDPYFVSAEPDLGRTVVIARAGGRVTYRPVGTSRSRRLTSVPVEVSFGARVDATNGRVRVTIARNRSGDTSQADFFDGVFRLSDQDRSAPYVATLTLAGRSYADVCGEEAATARASAAKRRSRKRVRRLWGDGRGRYRTRGRYSAATVRGTKWLTEDRCDGTLVRVKRGVVSVRDFTRKKTVTVKKGHQYLARAKKAKKRR